MTRPSSHAQRGVSLVEALVALAVLAFGMLAVVGLQATLRQNADIAKQRAEAVRIAQEAIEAARAYSVLGTTAGQVAYADLDTTAGATVAGYTTNTSFTLTQTVDTTAEPRRKVMTSSVTWTDRAGQAQGIQLFTTITGTPPELAGSLAVPATGSAIGLPGSRHPAIPRDSIDLEDRTSGFEPPGAPDGVRWVFSNTTGAITSICTSSDPSSCVSVNARLLRGFVRFSTDAAQPTPAQAETPPSEALPVQVRVDHTLPTPAATIACYETLTPATYIAYFCAVPVTADANPRWSGRSLVDGIDLATGINDASATRYRVCRYTPVRDCQPAVASNVWGQPGETLACTGSAPTPKRLMANADHPLNYANAAGALTNQNFLVIRAGDGSTAFTCPADDTSTPFINGNTWHHQPAS